MAQAAPDFDWNLNLPGNTGFLELLERQIASTSAVPDTSFASSSSSQRVSPETATRPDVRDRSDSQESNVPSMNTHQYRDEDDAEGTSDTDEEVDHKRRKNGGAGTPLEGKKGKTAKGKQDADGDDDGTGKKSRRKSSGEGKDDGKLTKRKEQNRAAQRAFRERKERHVKDLEDKVAALIASTEGQKSENENLRDLLARLQQENVMLKQSAFTFSFADKVGGTGTNVPVNAVKPPSPPSSLGEKDADSPKSYISSASSNNSYHNSVSPNTASSGDSPSSLFNTVSNPDTPPQHSFSSSGFNAFSAPNPKDLQVPGTSSRSNSDSPAPERPQQPIREMSMGGYSSSPSSFLNQTDGAQSAPSPPSFAFSPSAFFPSADDQPVTSPSGFQLLASNPSYTSFRDPSSSLDAQMDFFANPALSPSSNQLFGGQAQFDGTQFDDFFLNGMMPSFTPVVEQSNPLSPTSALMASLINDSPLSSNPSPPNLAPEQHQQRQGSSSSTVSTASSSGTLQYSAADVEFMRKNNVSVDQFEQWRTHGNGAKCPKSHSKEELDRLSKDRPLATIGPPVKAEETSPYAMLSGPSASAAMTAEKNRQVYPWDPSNHDTFFQNKIFLAADPTAKNMRLDQVWSKVLAMPGVSADTIDLDSLCAEFKGKAKCDGSRGGAVLDEQQVQQIMDEIPYRTKKQA